MQPVCRALQIDTGLAQRVVQIPEYSVARLEPVHTNLDITK